jgi:hypothetical protein
MSQQRVHVPFVNDGGSTKLNAVYRHVTESGITSAMCSSAWWKGKLSSNEMAENFGREEYGYLAARALEAFEAQHPVATRIAATPSAPAAKRVTPKPSPEPDVDPDDPDDDEPNDDAAKPGACPKCRMVNRPTARSCKWCGGSLPGDDKTAALATHEPLVLSRDS